jgi:two-component system, OmpR family, sensor histidine kinase ChvG
LKKLKPFTVLGTGIEKFLLSISFRLMLFNIVLVFLPMASLLYLNTYENQLLVSQEKAMVQQGRLLSAFLSNNPKLEKESSERILLNLKGRTEARLRILDRNSKLIADSSSLYKIENLNKEEEYSRSISKIPVDKESVLYRAATWPVRVYRKLFNPPLPVEAESFYNSKMPFTGIEVQSAMEGRYGAVTRLSSDGQKSVSLYIAIPITNQDQIIGAVLCSQSTYRILQDLYEIRLVILKIFLWSFLFAIIISAILAYSISFRIKRLKNDAESIRTGKGKLEGYFTPSLFMDEIGELSYSLKDLTNRLDDHLRNTSSFIQDFSHEFKNPLSIVQTASEMIPEASKEQRDRFLHLISQNSRRMESLLESIRDLSLLDKTLEEEEKNEVIIKTLLENMIDGFSIKYPERKWLLTYNSENSIVMGSWDNMGRVFINVFENANSFSDNNKPVLINMNNKQNGYINIEISNKGPGIPDGDLDKIFNRFYSNRSKNKLNHNGLGLSIVKAIVENYGGTIIAHNIDSGVLFIIKLPLKNKRM